MTVDNIQANGKEERAKALNAQEPTPEHEGNEEGDDDIEDGAPAAEGKLLAMKVTRVLFTMRNIGESKKKKKKKKPKKKSAKSGQSDPPRVGLSKFFPSGNYPVGEIQEYKDE